MKISELTERKIAGVEETDDLVEVVASDNGHGDEYDVYRDGQHIGCLYDNAGYRFSAGTRAGEDYGD